MSGIRSTTLAFLLMAIPDLVFTPFFLAAVVQLLGLAWSSAGVLGVAALLLRLPLYWWGAQYWVGPSQAVHERLAAQRPVSVDALLTADRRLSAIDRGFVVPTSLLWGLQVPLVVGGYHGFVGTPGNPFGEGLVVFLVTAAGVLGCYAEASPLYAWQMARLSGHNSLAAEALGVDLERPRQSVAGRLTVMALVLALVPLIIMIAYARSSSGRDDFALAERDAALAVARLATAGASDFPASFAGLSGDLALDRVSAFRLEPGRPAQRVGNALPGWASPERLVAVADGDAALPDHRLALRVARSEQGVVVGALVRMEERDIDRFPMALAVLLVVSLWAPICAWNLSRSVSVPLGRATEVMRRAVEVGDLSQMGTLPITTLDEVGRVTQYLNRVIASMRGLAAAAGRVGAGELDVEIAGTGELPEAFRQMLVRLRAVVQEVHSTSSELAAAATEILAASQEQEAASTSHSAGMTEITHTMESLSESSGGVAAAAHGVLENAERTLANTDHMVSRINELTGHANRIGDILDIIRDISDRADLLALNGSLEATRAGEAGLGFSLVAAEMRRLAERVTASVGDIKTLVADIRESGASTVVATEESKKLAESTTAAARSITMVSQQQQTSTEQVAQNVRAMAEVVRQAALANTQTRASAEGLKAHADHLAELVRTFRLGE